MDEVGPDSRPSVRRGGGVVAEVRAVGIAPDCHETAIPTIAVRGGLEVVERDRRVQPERGSVLERLEAGRNVRTRCGKEHLHARRADSQQADLGSIGDGFRREPRQRGIGPAGAFRALDRTSGCERPEGPNGSGGCRPSVSGDERQKSHRTVEREEPDPELVKVALDRWFAVLRE